MVKYYSNESNTRISTEASLKHILYDINSRCITGEERDTELIDCRGKNALKKKGLDLETMKHKTNSKKNQTVITTPTFLRMER